MLALRLLILLSRSSTLGSTIFNNLTITSFKAIPSRVSYQLPNTLNIIVSYIN